MCSLQQVSDSNKHSLPLNLPVKELLFFILFLSTNIPGYSQQKPFRIYTVNDGLISNAPQQIFQDDDGFIWIGSNEGISIYDGNRFVNYTTENKGLSDNIVNHFFQKDKNEVWVLHSNGIDVFVKRKFKKTLPIKGVGFMMWTRDHRIMATGTNGIYELIDGKAHLIFSSAKQFYGLIEIGNFFLANETPWEGTVLLDHSFHILDTYIHHGTFLKDKSNCWWYGDKISLLDTIALQKGFIRLLPTPVYLNQINDGHISYPFTDSDGFIWVSSDKGVVRIDKDGNIKKFDLANGTTAFFEDAEGNIWAQGSGYIKFFSKYIDVFSADEGLLPQAVASIAEDSYHNAWIAQANRISCIYQNKIYKFNNPGFNKHGASFPRIMIQGDSLWMAFFGLRLFKIHYDPQPHLQLIKQWLSYQQKKLIFASDNLCHYADGSILVNFDDGLFRVTKNSKLQKIGDLLFYKFLVSGDEIWNGPVTEGVDRWKIIPGKDSLHLQLMEKYNNLPGLRVLSMAKDKVGNFWMGTYYKGVIKFEKQNNDSFLIHNYDMQNGLPSNLVYNIFIDHTGKLYLNTSHGFCVLHTEHDSVYFENLNSKYGFFDNLNDITENKDGDLWLSSGYGAVRIKKTLQQKNLPPKVFITEVFCNNKSDTSFDFNKSSHSFSYKQNNLLFEFTATSFRNEEQVLYSYQLQSDKVDSTWSQPQKIHSLSFAALSPGHYTFRVKALTADDVWSKTPAEYSFIIRPPFYKTAWFAILCVLLVALIGYLIHIYRIRQILKVERLRLRIARDLHDDVGATLSSISLYSEMVKQQTKNLLPSVSPMLDKMGKASDNMVSAMSDIVWAINPAHDEGEDLCNRMQSYAAEICGLRQVQLQFDVNETVSKMKLNMELRKNLYLIFKEAVNNALKYSQCNLIGIMLTSKDGSIRMSIHDNGKGFRSQDEYEGNGLKNMRLRAKEIAADLHISSEKSQGCRIDLSCKIT
jgi:ligand-binding sensor domain-containing protein/two-component sensor histidine kinase